MQLTRRDTDINAPNKEGRTPLLEYLVQRGNDESVILTLLSLGADPSISPGDGYNIFYYLARGDFSPEVYKEAIARGAEPDIPVGPFPGSGAMDITEGASPLAWLAHSGKLTPELVHVFADGGADINAADRKGEFVISHVFKTLQRNIKEEAFTGIVCRKPVTSVMWRNAHALDFNNEHTTLLNITVNCYI